MQYIIKNCASKKPAEEFKLARQLDSFCVDGCKVASRLEEKPLNCVRFRRSIEGNPELSGFIQSFLQFVIKVYISVEFNL